MKVKDRLYPKKDVLSIPPDHPAFDNSDEIRRDSRTIWREDQDVGSGAWVFISHSPSVKEFAAPKRFHIYWAVPCIANVQVKHVDWENGGEMSTLCGEVVGRDRFCRQAVQVLTSEMVTLFTDEYSVVPDERLETYKELGYEAVPLNTDHLPIEDFGIKFLEKGRALVEEEREIIWALMLDGLSESAACSEYFCGRHVDASSNRNMYYRPAGEALEFLIANFGE